jgi:hypothetical protein
MKLRTPKYESADQTIGCYASATRSPSALEYTDLKMESYQSNDTQSVN